MLSDIPKDVLYGLRMLRRNPGFTAVAILTLALGIGANTTVFSVINGVLLRPLPFEDSSQLAMVWETFPEKGLLQGSASLPNFVDWKARNHTFENLAAFTQGNLTMTSGDRPERVSFADVTHGFFDLLCVKPLIGRKFFPEEDRPGGDPVIILSHTFWKKLSGGDPDYLENKLILNGNPYTVVGVMPPDFDFPLGTDLWSPLARDPARAGRRSQYLHVLARLKPGISREQAQTDMDAVTRQLAEEYPVEDGGWGANVVPLLDQTVGNARTPLLVLLGAVGFVLLIATVNIANLMLARAVGRMKEMAIRSTLGAGPGRLVRQLLTESLLLALLGGLSGVLLAHAGIKAMLALQPGNLPRIGEINLDWQALSFAFLLSLLAGVLSGLFPALSTARTDLVKSLKEGGRSHAAGERKRLRSALVASEVALAVVLLIGAGLLLRSFYQLVHVDAGFDGSNVFTFRTYLPSARYPDATKLAAYYDEILQRMRALPGMEAAGAVQIIPLERAGNEFAIAKEGDPYLHPDGSYISAMYRTVSTDYHQVMGTPLLRGRYFTEQDTAGSLPVVLINQTMARLYWPDEDPIGKRFSIAAGNNSPLRTIVGIVSDVRHFGLDAPYRPEMFIPYSQAQPWTQHSLAIVVRASGSLTTVQLAAQRLVQEIDPQLPVFGVQTMESLLTRSTARERFTLLLLSTFAALAVSLAAVGIYGVISYAVSQRTHEFGVRMALGAQKSDILKLVLYHGFRLAALGLTLGMAGAFGLTRYMQSLLFEITPTDSVTFGGGALLLAGVALAACYIPARRATKVDPMVALRYE